MRVLITIKDVNVLGGSFNREYEDIERVIYEEYWLHLYKTQGQKSINLKNITVLDVEEID